MRSLIVSILKRAGYEIRRLPRPVAVDPGAGSRKYADQKIYVGCGDDTRPGFIGCDLRKTDSVEIQCKAWELSHHCSGVAEIYTRHMLEHLTFKESFLTLQDWYRCLRGGGRVEILVPNMEFHIDQWLRAEWSDASLSEPTSDASWASAGFWGWQRECDPAYEDYSTSHWDVHKSGYDERSIAFFLEKAGFARIETSIVDRCHLRAVAFKGPGSAG